MISRGGRERCIALAAMFVGCQAAPDSAVREAEAILDGAQRVVGVWPTPEMLQLLADAVVDGPTASFRTLVYSSVDGRVRMEQSPSGFIAGVGDSADWFVDAAAGVIRPLGERLSFVRGHELHMLAAVPRSRFGTPEFIGRTDTHVGRALAVRLSLSTGDSMVAYFHPADTLPLGLRVMWTEPDVLVSWSDWIRVDGMRMFRQAVFRQGDEEFVYAYDRLEVGSFPDRVFEAR